MLQITIIILYFMEWPEWPTAVLTWSVLRHRTNVSQLEFINFRSYLSLSAVCVFSNYCDQLGLARITFHVRAPKNRQSINRIRRFFFVFCLCVFPMPILETLIVFTTAIFSLDTKNEPRRAHCCLCARPNWPMVIDVKRFSSSDELTQ